MIAAILIVCVLAIPSQVLAACSWVGNTGTVASPYDDADVQDCVTDAAGKTGAVTISIPTASVTWGTAVSIDMSTGWANVTALTVTGAGIGSTVITGKAFTIIGKSGKTFRLTAMKFANLSDDISIDGDATGWRVDNLYFDHPLTRQIAIGHDLNGKGLLTYGVVDSCTVYHAIDGAHMFVHVRAPGAAVDGTVTNNGGNAAWQAGMASRWGTANNVYIENNTLESEILVCATDSEVGGGFVFRYNTLTNGAVCTHDIANKGRGTLGGEVYGNTFTSTLTYSSRHIGLRSGTWRVYNNTITTGANPYSTKGGSAIGPVLYTSYPVCEPNGTGPWDGVCDGTTHKYTCLGAQYWASDCTTGGAADDSKCGGETGACQDLHTFGGNGLPCRDQIGYNDALAASPTLSWNNKRNGTHEAPVVYDGGEVTRDGCVGASGTVTSSGYIRADYEYCDHATTMPATCNGVTTTYTAYTYPHPLRGVAGPMVLGSSGGSLGVSSSGGTLTLQ